MGRFGVCPEGCFLILILSLCLSLCLSWCCGRLCLNGVSRFDRVERYNGLYIRMEMFGCPAARIRSIVGIVRHCPDPGCGATKSWTVLSTSSPVSSRLISLQSPQHTYPKFRHAIHLYSTPFLYSTFRRPTPGRPLHPRYPP